MFPKIVEKYSEIHTGLKADSKFQFNLNFAAGNANTNYRKAEPCGKEPHVRRTSIRSILINI